VTNLIADAERLRRSIPSDAPEDVFARAEERTVSVKHGGGRTLARPAPLQRERGGRYDLPVPGPPDNYSNVIVFSYDQHELLVLTDSYGATRRRARTVVEDGVSIRYELDPDDRWIVSAASGDTYHDERLVSHVWLSVRPTETVEREDYIYDADGRVQRVVQRRTWNELGSSPELDVLQERTWTALYGLDEQLETVLDGTNVAWRRRRGFAKLRAAAEDALVRELLDLGAVTLRHQQDGAWSDQLQLIADAPLNYAQPTAAALRALDEQGLPRDGEPRQLLLTVAARLNARGVSVELEPEDER